MKTYKAQLNQFKDTLDILESSVNHIKSGYWKSTAIIIYHDGFIVRKYSPSNYSSHADPLPDVYDLVVFCGGDKHLGKFVVYAKTKKALQDYLIDRDFDYIQNLTKWKRIKTHSNNFELEF